MVAGQVEKRRALVGFIGVVGGCPGVVGCFDGGFCLRDVNVEAARRLDRQGGGVVVGGERSRREADR